MISKFPVTPEGKICSPRTLLIYFHFSWNLLKEKHHFTMFLQLIKVLRYQQFIWRCKKCSNRNIYKWKLVLRTYMILKYLLITFNFNVCACCRSFLIFFNTFLLENSFVQFYILWELISYRSVIRFQKYPNSVETEIDIVYINR